jgi:hypothetical protein
MIRTQLEGNLRLLPGFWAHLSIVIAYSLGNIDLLSNILVFGTRAILTTRMLISRNIFPVEIRKILLEVLHLVISYEY